jgi:hypothetical protein
MKRSGERMELFYIAISFFSVSFLFFTFFVCDRFKHIVLMDLYLRVISSVLVIHFVSIDHKHFHALFFQFNRLLLHSIAHNTRHRSFMITCAHAQLQHQYILIRPR